MNEAITALLGAVTGFFLPSVASYFRSKTKGKRFENAVKGELDEAKGRLHEKMIWLSRDHRPLESVTDKKLLVESDGKLLYLGEEEEFNVSLPFWDQNLRDIVEATSTRSFGRMSHEVLLLRGFASKFREMKLSFKVGGGDPKAIALACYGELVGIHRDLISE